MTRTNSTLAAMMRPVPAAAADAVNYADFTFRAEVDWVEIYVRTEKPTNYWTVISLVGEKYAKPLDKDAGGAATRFMIKFQDPQSWQAVQDKIDALAVDHVLIEGPEVAAIEISFDAYSKFEFRDDLVAMAGRFYKYSQLIGHENRRMATQGESDGLMTHQYNLQRLANGYSAYAGDQETTKNGPPSPQALRVYVKEVDSGKPLPLSAHRARTERTFHMNELQRRPLSWWKRHDFTSDAHYFKFRKLKPVLPACVRVAVEACSQIGESCNFKRSEGGGVRRYRKSTVTDVQLNRLAYEALRNLTNRMQHVNNIAKKRSVAKIAGVKVM